MQKGDAMDAAERSERIPDIVIITGMSGSGRTRPCMCSRTWAIFVSITCLHV